MAWEKAARQASSDMTTQPFSAGRKGTARTVESGQVYGHPVQILCCCFANTGNARRGIHVEREVADRELGLAGVESDIEKELVLGHLGQDAYGCAPVGGVKTD